MFIGTIGNTLELATCFRIALEVNRLKRMNIFYSVEPKKALRIWVEFNQGKNNDQCLEYDDGARLNDSEAAALIESVANVKNPGDIQAYEKQKRNEVIKLLKRKGLSIRQIERLTGVSFGVIRGI